VAAALVVAHRGRPVAGLYSDHIETAGQANMQIPAVRDAPKDPSQAPGQHRWSVTDYYRMAEAGLLGEHDRVELIEGELIDMAPIGSRHAYYVDRLVELIYASRKGSEDSFMLRCQSPVRLSPWSEPRPDIALLRPRSYADAHPGPEDVLLIIEVADSSLQYDREVKLALYARHGIAEVWLVDLRQNLVTMYREPTPQGYRRTGQPAATERIEPAALAGLSLDVAAVFAEG
jgi:Uma2 family endonuclease